MSTPPTEPLALRVRVLDGPLRGASHPVSGRLAIGRSNGSHIQLVHDGVSRQHAQITTDDQGRHILVDLDSSNGTFIGGRRIRRQILSPGTVFKIMRVKLVYEPAVEQPVECDDSGTFAVQPTDHRTLRQTTDYVAADLPCPVSPSSSDGEDADIPIPQTRAQSSTGPAAQALGEDRHRVIATRPDGTVYEGSLVDDLIEYRALRARELRGETPTEEEFDRTAILHGRLRAPPSRFPSKRIFERFSCHFPAKLRFAGEEEMSIAVLDLGADGAKIRAYDHNLPHGKIVWLAIHLVSRGRAQTVVFTGRVTWTCRDHVGLSLGGMPGWEGGRDRKIETRTRMDLRSSLESHGSVGSTMNSASAHAPT
ncbi:MAG: FHA domain-containing protein [Myxococcota bacterium]